MTEVFGKNPVTSREFPIVLFDAGGTLLHSQPPLIMFFKVELEQRADSCSEAEFEAAWTRVVQKLNVDSEHNPEFVLPRNFWFEALLSELKIPEPRRAELKKDLIDAYYQKVRLAIPQLCVRVCEVLHDRGYRLGIVSNNDHTLADVLRTQGVLDLFEVVITSADAHALKPDPKPYRMALEEMGAADERAIFVGESYAIDVIGAQRADLKAILYDPTYREMRALSETTTEALEKVVSIDVLRQNRRLQGVKVVTRFDELLEFLM